MLTRAPGFVRGLFFPCTASSVLARVRRAWGEGLQAVDWHSGFLCGHRACGLLTTEQRSRHQKIGSRPLRAKSCDAKAKAFRGGARTPPMTSS